MKHLLALWAAVAFPALPFGAQSVKLNGPLAQRPRGTLAPYVVTSPDGARYIYSGDRDGDGVRELWTVAASGKEAPVLLSEDATDGWVTPDGDLVVHGVGPSQFGARELAVVPLDASAPSRSLTGPIPAHANLIQYATTADSAYLVYTVDQERDEVYELYSAALAGGAPAKLSGTLVAGGSVQSFALAQRAALVLYVADQDADELFELYVVPADGSQPARKLPIPLVAGGDATLVDFDQDASHVIYLADQEEDERFELYRIATDGSGAPEKLSGPLVPGGDVGTGYLNSFVATSYDQRRVLYTADQDVDELFELYSVPADGSAPAVKLCSLSDQGLLVSGQSWDSRWWLLQEEDNLVLHSVPTDGSGPVRPLTDAVFPGAVPFFVQISSDSQRVVYVSDQDTDEVFELFGVPIDGSAAPVKLSGPMTPGGDVSVDRRNLLVGFWVMQEGVLYEADQEVDGVNELYLASLDGSAPARKLVAAPVRSAYPSYAPFVRGTPLRDFGRVLFYRESELWSVETLAVPQPIRLDQADLGAVAAGIGAYHVTPDGARVVYQAQEAGDRVGRFYSVPPDKLSQKIALVPDLLPGESFGTSRLTPDGSRLVFSARRFPGPRMQLFSVPSAGGEAPRVLGPSLADNGELTGSFQFTPDGQRVLFPAGIASGGALYVAPVDASTPALQLALLATPILAERISADGTRVAFLSAQQAWSVPLDGSAPAVRVSAGARPVLGDLQVTSDGARVVYRTVGSATAIGALFSAPSDGLAEPLRISVIAQNQGDVTGFAVAADGTRAVYRADAAVDERFELFSVPLDGSAAPVRLHPPLGATRDIEDFQVSPDSERVLFRSDARTDNLLELYSVPLDGSAPPVRLSVELLPGGGVGQFRIASDSARVVYRAGGFSQPPALYSTPIRGPRGGVRLSGEIPGGSVASFALSADGRTVAFTSVHPVFRFALHAVPISGAEKATELVAPLQGGIQDYVLDATGRRIVHRSALDTPGVIELYAITYSPSSKLLRR